MFVPPSRRHSCSSLARLYNVCGTPGGSPPWMSTANLSAIHLPITAQSAPRPPQGFDPAHLVARLSARALRPPQRAISNLSHVGMRPKDGCAVTASGAPDVPVLVLLARKCRRLSSQHPDRQALSGRVEALLRAPQATCRAVALDIAEAIGIDQSLPTILRCAADPEASVRARARLLLTGPGLGRAYSLAQAMLAEPEDFEVQYAGLRLLHAVVPVSEVHSSPRVRLLEEHLTAWRRHGALHYAQAASAICMHRHTERVSGTALTE